MEQLENVFEILPREIDRSVAALSKAKDLNERKIHSEILLNLCRSMEVFMEAMGTISDMEDLSELLADDTPLKLHDPQKKKKKHAKKKKPENDDGIPF